MTTATGDVSYPPGVQRMHRYRWPVGIVCGLVMVCYPSEWFARGLVAGFAFYIGATFFSSQWCYRVYAAFRNGLRDPVE